MRRSSAHCSSAPAAKAMTARQARSTCRARQRRSCTAQTGSHMAQAASCAAQSAARAVHTRCEPRARRRGACAWEPKAPAAFPALCMAAKAGAAPQAGVTGSPKRERRGLRSARTHHSQARQALSPQQVEPEGPHEHAAQHVASDERQAQRLQTGVARLSALGSERHRPGRLRVRRLCGAGYSHPE